MTKTPLFSANDQITAALTAASKYDTSVSPYVAAAAVRAAAIPCRQPVSLSSEQEDAEMTAAHQVDCAVRQLRHALTEGKRASTICSTMYENALNGLDDFVHDDFPTLEFIIDKIALD